MTLENHYNKYITFTDENTLENVKFQIYDTSGRLIKNILLVNPTTTFEIDDLTSVFYFYTVSSNDKIIPTRKLISK